MIQAGRPSVATLPGMMPAGMLARYKAGQVELTLRLIRFRAQMDTMLDTKAGRAGRDMATVVRGSRVLLAGPDASATERQTGLS
jgi:hypothetical protein